MKWFNNLPQTVGEFLWCEADLHCWIIGLVTICRLDSYKPNQRASLGAWTPGNNGGSMLYKWMDGTEAVMCFGLSAPCRNPTTGLPVVDGWCKFNGPKT